MNLFYVKILQVENLEPVAGGSSNGVEIKVEPAENNVKNEIVQKDIKKKRPSEDKVGNQEKKQKTEKPSTSLDTSGKTLVTVNLMMKIHDNLNKLL